MGGAVGAVRACVGLDARVSVVVFLHALVVVGGVGAQRARELLRQEGVGLR